MNQNSGIVVGKKIGSRKQIGKNEKEATCIKVRPDTEIKKQTKNSDFCHP
jgi:hypothetical protein